MPQKGEFKSPIESAEKAFNRAISITDSFTCDFALYMMGGQIRCARKSSSCYERRINKFKNALIGVYRRDVDYSLIKQDIEAYYEIFN
jgi:hypothetical protein